MNNHALSVLELRRVLEFVAGHATSALGAARVNALTPGSDIPTLEREHARVGAVRAITTGDEPWHPDAIPDVGDALGRLRVEGSRWNGIELLGAATLLRSSRRTREALRDDRRPAVARAVLAVFADALAARQPLEQLVERTIQDDGLVRDGASPALARIRRELRASQGELIRILEREISRLEPQHRVNDMSVTMRNGRYVIPVRRGGQAVTGGIVHDASSSGGTLFVEPPAAVAFGNRIRELEAEEFEEVERILLALTDDFRPHRAELLASLEALVTLDSLFARAVFAERCRCSPARLVPARQGFAIRGGRHPLLLAQGVAVIPFDLAMDPAERTLLVSGPNTGGKTVLLKALGLMSAMSQCGIPAPVGPESSIAIVDNVFADVGDEQSIEASLSTFSAHVKNLGEILRLATADSMVLVDELGSGTDPVEGAALGWAVLEELTARGALTVATTHLGSLKELAGQVAGVVNASLQFDAVALAPTYRLIKGVPGRSYGIAIARRLSLPEQVVQRAEERLPRQERDVAALIEQLEKRHEALAEREREAETVLADARDRVARVARREANVRERERVAERESRQEARRHLLDARGEVDRLLRELKSRGAAQLDDAAREARQAAERLAARESSEIERLDREEANLQRKTIAATASAAGAAGAVAVGDQVELATVQGALGRVLDLRDADAVVAVGAVKLTVPRATLRRSTRAAAPETAVAWSGDVPEVEARTEIDLRGLRMDDAEAVVLQSIDDAIRADLHRLRIIHGKGTGVLRERVTEMLRKDTRVKSFRLGAWNEGGAGVTVAELA